MSDKANKSKSKDKESSKDTKDKKDKDKEKKSDKDKSKDKKSSIKKSEEKESKKNKESTLDIQNDLISEIDANLQNDKEQVINENKFNSHNDPYMMNNNINSNRNFSKYNNNNDVDINRCDGCYDREGICFCINCEKIFCKTCEDQIHLVPSNRLHERVPITDIYHLKKLCYHHHNPLKFYCESCEEPVCQECQMVGPHNNKLHRISNVFESFRKKFNYVNNLVQKSLLSKFDQLTNQIQEIEFTIEDVKNVKNSIERDIRTEYSTLIENLRGEEGKKLAILQYDSSILQKEINKIQDIVNVVNDINMADSPDMIAFLLRYSQLNETVELCITKPFKKTIDVVVDDFPRELDEKRMKLEKYDKMRKLLKAKDDIIWNLIQERKAREEKEVLKLKEKTHNEISEWAKLSDKYAMELKKYHLVCNFCGCYLEENTVNSLCPQNSGEEEEVKANYITSAVPAEIKNTKRHYFGPPSKEFEAKAGEINYRKVVVETVKPNPTEKKLKSSDSEFYKNPFENNILNDSKMASSYRSRSTSPPGNLRYSDESVKEKVNQDWVWKVASVIQKSNINFYQVLSDYDLDCDGFVSPEDIRFAFVKLQINLSDSDMDNMLRYFNISAMGRISTKEFAKNFMGGYLNEGKNI